jgi:hypothetical protein
MPRCGLIGTITSDTIVHDDGLPREAIGGVLYQAAALSGLGVSAALFTQCGESLRPAVEALIADWPNLDRRGLMFVPGPGNRVRLRYSERSREREEVLESVVPPLDPAAALEALSGLDFLVMVFNSGFDISLRDWRSIVARASCPVWLDVHSLALEQRVGAHRDYRSVPDWPDWVKGAAYLQANRQEVGCLMGHPERWANEEEIQSFFIRAFATGARAVFVTMGKDGVLAATPGEVRRIPAPVASAVIDATGCGDVFAAAAIERLLRGEPVFQAVEAGVALATKAVAVSGLRETYLLASRESRMRETL